MLPTDDPEELQLIAEFRNAKISLLLIGLFSVPGGLFVLVMGLLFSRETGPNGMLVLSGILLTTSGLWFLIVRSATGLIPNGVAMICLGVSIVGSCFVGPTTVHPLKLGFIGLGTMGWGVLCFKLNATYSKTLSQAVSSRELEMLAVFVKNTMKAKGAYDDRIIEFDVTSRGDAAQWRGRLLGNMAVFVNKLTRKVMVGRKADITIEPLGKVSVGSSLKATITIRNHNWEVKIAPRSIERYRDWKLTEVEGESCGNYSSPADHSDESESEDD
jgi:hypothetical protein